MTDRPGQLGGLLAALGSPSHRPRGRRPVVTAAERNRKLERLAARGPVTVTVKFDPRTHWVVLLRRPARSLFEWATGWNDICVEAEDLDAAIDQALNRSTPRRWDLSELVYYQRAGGIGRKSPVLIGSPVRTGQHR